jgi:hypothetical protein
MSSIVGSRLGYKFNCIKNFVFVQAEFLSVNESIWWPLTVWCLCPIEKLEFKAIAANPLPSRMEDDS